MAVSIVPSRVRPSIGRHRPGIVLILALALVLGMAPKAAQAQDANAGAVDLDRMIPVEVATVGVDLQSGAPIALLRDASWDQVLPIWIGQAEYEAIARVLQNVAVPRPMTHDLLASMIGELGGTVEEVVVHTIRESTYIATIRIRTGSGEGGSVREVDSRPSDGLALAVRTGAAIRVNPDFFEDVPDVDFLASEGEHHIVRAHGVTVGRASEELAAEFDFPDREGVVVLSVTDAVERRGLERGDFIVDINGTVPARPVDFLEALVQLSEGDAVQVTVVRNGEEESITLPPRRGAPARQTE